MIQKVDFNTVLKKNYATIPTATVNNNGLMSNVVYNNNFLTFDLDNNRIVKISVQGINRYMGFRIYGYSTVPSSPINLDIIVMKDGNDVLYYSGIIAKSFKIMQEVDSSAIYLQVSSGSAISAIIQYHAKYIRSIFNPITVDSYPETAIDIPYAGAGFSQDQLSVISDNLFKSRETITLSENINIAQWLVANTDKPNGIYETTGTNPSDILSDWGTLIKMRYSAIYISKNLAKEVIFFSKDNSGWKYSIYKGTDAVRPVLQSLEEVQ